MRFTILSALSVLTIGCVGTPECPEIEIEDQIEDTGSIDTEDGYEFEQAPIEDLPEQAEDTEIDEPQVMLYIQFVPHYEQGAVQTEPGVVSGTSDILLTAEGGDVPLRGLILTSYIDGDIDGYFGMSNEDGMFAHDYIESVHLSNVDTGWLEIGAAGLTSDGRVPLFVEDWETVTIEEDATMELNLVMRVWESVVPVEDLAFTLDLDAASNVWVDGDVDVVIESNNGGSRPEAYLYF